MAALWGPSLSAPPPLPRVTHLEVGAAPTPRPSSQGATARGQRPSSTPELARSTNLLRLAMRRATVATGRSAGPSLGGSSGRVKDQWLRPQSLSDLEADCVEGLHPQQGEGALLPLPRPLPPPHGGRGGCVAGHGGEEGGGVGHLSAPSDVAGASLHRHSHSPSWPLTWRTKMTSVAAALALVLPWVPMGAAEWSLVGRTLLMEAPARASGLLQMPPIKLSNDYYLVRAGESEWEALGLLHTNPVDKTNVQSGLSELGKRQAVAAARQLARLDACSAECWVWPSISQRAYQTAEVIAYINDLTYNRIVPEYSFLDARGVGAYENSPVSVMEEVYQLDSADERQRPPPYTDGTPSESAHDVFVRVRQMMSILETQYSGDTIIVISPDSDNLSVLQAALTGLDLRSHHTLRFSPGEVRHVELPENAQIAPAISGIVKI